ncbi:MULTISPECIES: hypothetical protein [Streptomyces]|uniref:hypothetical protein n=1 Tax=Streptomyces TaxID=1883 RepID=UPI0016006EF6|nr:hypothetical protein [Streptomyces murinus]MBA9050607.1 hypothetical protein [Streptomyces murinus]
MLPLIDQEPGQQASRHDNLRTWGIDPGVGERLLETFAALAAHAALSDAASPAAGIDAVPLSAVAAAVTGKRDIELLAGLPERFTDDRDQQAVSLFRLYAYKGGSFSRMLFQLSRELRHPSPCSQTDHPRHPRRAQTSCARPTTPVCLTDQHEPGGGGACPRSLTVRARAGPGRARAEAGRRVVLAFSQLTRRDPAEPES